MSNTDRTLQESLTLLEAMFKPGFDWESWFGGPEFGDGPETVFRTAYRWHDYRQGKLPVPTYVCGGRRFANTPASVYRAMYLLKPSEVDWSDMYKTATLVDFVSPHGEFFCSFQLYKYEACLRYGCAKAHFQSTPCGVIAGAPDADNGNSCTSDLGNKWFALAGQALERTWDVYWGNDFTV